MAVKKEIKAKVGLREIAALSKVSVASVSRVLNGNSRVAPSLRSAVLAAAAKLNVDLSQPTKGRTLAFLFSNRLMLHPFHSRLLAGAEAHCAANGWDIIFLSFNYSANTPSEELHLPKVVQRRDVVRALILAGTNSDNLIKLLDLRGIPYVALGNNIVGDAESAGNDLVFSDDVQGSADMTRYLLSIGHRHICFVGNLRQPWYSRCFAGYSRAMEEAGLPVRSSTIDSEDDAEVGYLGTKSLLSRGEPVTAIFAGNDYSAHGVYRALRDSGLRIPEDVSVVGVDDTISSWLYPGLTSLREFPEQIGKQMVELALSRIAKPGSEPQRVLIPTEVIKRDSCRPIAIVPELAEKPRDAHKKQEYVGSGLNS
jgi:DNA-binding LacI/PurR family transcriptional regulator